MATNRNVIIFVADGLRPGSVNATDTPTLYSVQQGVNFTNSHSLFPTFTTPNASAIATGHYLGDTGDFSNTVYTGYPIINSNGTVTPFIENDPILADLNANANLADPDTGFNKNNFLTEESLLAYARLNGYSTAAIGKLGPVAIFDVTQDTRTGNSTTANIIPKTVILDDSTYINSIANATTPPVTNTASGSQSAIPIPTAIANALNTAGLIGTTVPGTTTVATTIGSIRSNQPAGNLTTAGTLNSNAQQQQFFADATTKAILPQFVKDIQAGTSKGFATVYWSRDPDGTQHNNGDAFNAADPGNNSLTIGINGPTSKKGVQDADANLKQLIDYLKATDDPANPGKKLYDNTDIFVTADHGFSTISRQAVGIKSFDANGVPTYINTTSYAASLDYYTTDATTGVKTPTVHKGFLPTGFVAIDLAKDLGATLYDPNSPSAPVTTANINNIQYNVVDPTKGQNPGSGNGVIGGTGKVTNGVIDPGTKVVVAANGGSDLLYVPSNDPALVKQIVALLAQKDYISGIFTDDKFGNIPGALKMSSIGLIGTADLPTPSIVINFKTFSTNPKDPNDPQSQVEVADTPLQQGQGMHGTFGRGDTFNNMAAIGPDFKTGYVDAAPVSNVDVVPTLAKILGWTLPSTGSLKGRSIDEALVGGPSTVNFSESTLVSTPVNGVSSVLNVQKVGSTAYFDVAGVAGGTVGLGQVAFSGVAAGDATTNDAILWTRTYDTVTKKGDSVNLRAQVSTDANFGAIDYTYNVLPKNDGLDHDGTAKVDATGLKSGTQYYYRFLTESGAVSSVGKFKTAYDAYTPAPVKFGFSGDADGKWRPYASTQGFGSLNLDYFEFLGDTIYETASTGSPATASAITNPAQALNDYHRKYLENLQPATAAGGAAGLQTFYASQGNYTALDNHELGNGQLINGGSPLAVLNDSSNGTTNTAYDVNTTGTFLNQTVAFKTLVQAYSDYQPIKENIISAPNDPRTNGTQQLYNAQQWGKNVININTDTRSYRDDRLKNAAGQDDSGPRADNPDRTLLGKTQLAWLKQTLLDAQKNGTAWKFVSVSDPIDQIEPLAPGSLDSGKSWIGGYRAERNDLLNFIADNKINNVVFLSCDDHQNRINEINYTDKSGVVKTLANALSIVDGPMGAGGPDTVTDHSFANIKTLADTLAAKETAGGLNPIGLDKNFMGLNNVRREGDPTADTNRSPVDFYSPDTFNYTTFDISADGKTLSVNVQGVNSVAGNTFPEASAANPVRSILSFNLVAAPAAPTVPTFDFNVDKYAVTEGTTGTSNATVRVTRSGDVSGANTVQLFLGDGTATGALAAPTADTTTKGVSSSATPYMIPTTGSGVSITSIFTAGDSVNNKPDGTPYKMVGIPDGLGAFDNGDGTFTLLMNQEIGNTLGIARAHGGIGAFVSSWIIDKSTLAVKSGEDLIKKVYNWNSATQSSDIATSTISFNRFCSADLPSTTAFYNSKTGLGTQERIFMDGEEGGTTGYALATVATGASKGNAYVLGKFNPSTNGSGLTAIGGWENLLANPFSQDKTVVIGNNDGGTGVLSNALAVYVGSKQSTGTEVDKAGLTNGITKFVNITGNPKEIVDDATQATNITNGTAFTLSTTASTTFARPEDGIWDPNDPSKYYFVTTDRLDKINDGLGTAATAATDIGRSRLWRLNFADITNPDAGGTIDQLLDGTEGQVMFDNLTLDKYGHILLQEDTGNAQHNSKIWQYDIATDTIKQLAKHDPARFGDVVGGVSTPATAPFNLDEESSGIIDAQDILGPGWFLFDTQAHNAITGELVEGGQLQALFNPDTYKSAVDYKNTPITVSFAAGEQFKDVQIPIAGDLKPEGTETVNLSLRNPSAGVVGTSQSTATLSIANAATTADLTPPTVKSISNVPTTSVTKAVEGIVVEFSEALKAGTFDFNDITLKKDGGANLVTNAVTVAKLSDTKYQINGLTALQSAPGAYELVVNGTTVQDVAGNVGANSLSAKFSIVPGTVAPFDNKDIDLRDMTGKGNFATQVSYEAVYNNYGGFYTVDDTAGKIGTLKPGDVGYAEAAIKRAVANISKTEATGSYQFTGGQILAPYLIANGTAADFLAKNVGNTGSASGSLPNAYFIYADANPDKIEHIKAIGNYQFAAEDTFGGGDKDFNDFIIQLTYKSA
jgi:phosphodiesterase/alkaline phosphatase D-like protein/arylsulfatase A-like enzyme